MIPEACRSLTPFDVWVFDLSLVYRTIGGLYPRFHEPAGRFQSPASPFLLGVSALVSPASRTILARARSLTSSMFLLGFQRTTIQSRFKR